MSNLALAVHQLFNQQRRFRFPFAQGETYIPSNGIYVLFESGEKYYGLDRIVRIGTHRGTNQLRSRLGQHFLQENKNRSIFRKNIGRCILNQNASSYLPVWELDTTARAARLRYSELLKPEFEREVENRISRYIRANLSFCVFEIEQMADRLFWESRLISTLSNDQSFAPSKSWLGLDSPKEKIRRSGLWQVNELYKDSLTVAEFEVLKTLVKGI